MKRRSWIAAVPLLAASAVFGARSTSLRRSNLGPALRANPEALMIGTARTGGGASQRPRLSADGRYVAFESTARLVESDPDHRRDIYVFDRNAGTYRLVRRPAGSTGAAGVAISDDGAYVAFHSFDVMARQGVEPITSILLIHLPTGDARRIPQPWRGESVKGEAIFPQLGPKATHMIFTSNGPGLAGRVPTPIRQVYVYDRSTEEIRLISRSRAGAPANRACAEPHMSADARYAAYLSAATNLATELPLDSLAYHLYFVDRSSGTTIRVDEIERGIDPSGWIVDQLDMDQRGENVVFEARVRKPSSPKATMENTDLFLFERSSMTVTRLTSGLFAGRSSMPAISGNGRWIAFSLAPSPRKKDGGIVVHDRRRDSWRMAVSGRCVNPAISADGRWIAYESADPVVTHDRRNTPRVFVQENPSYEPNDAGH